MFHNPVASDTVNYTITTDGYGGYKPTMGYDVYPQGILTAEVHLGLPTAQLLTSAGPASTNQYVPKPVGAFDFLPRRDENTTAWVRGQGNTFSYMANYQSVDTVVQSPLDDFPVEAILEGDYLVYLKNKTAPQELWAYQLSTNAHTRLTNTNWNWTISEMNNGITNFDIDGTRVVWAASYPDQGAIYADYDIYSYDLSVGPSSYYQVTKNTTEDYMPRVAGGRLFWTGQDESPLQAKIYEEKNGAPVHFCRWCVDRFVGNNSRLG